jgi:isocitrate dehydrogenase kinase/phosphatase
MEGGERIMINKKLYVEYITGTGEMELLIQDEKIFHLIPVESEERIVRDVSYLYSSFLELVEESILKSLFSKLSINLETRRVVKYNKEEDLFYLDMDLLSSFISNNKNMLEIQIESHRFFLETTDWYVVRFMETGVPIPELVKEQRKEKREIISLLNQQLNELE